MDAKLTYDDNNYYLETIHDRIGKMIIATTDHELGKILNYPFKLSKQNCDEIFGVVDVRKLAREYFLNEYSFNGKNNLPYKDSDVQITKNDFRNGFNKAMELNKDKLFTAEDMKGFAGYVWKMVSNRIDMSSIEHLFEKYTQPTEIEVEVKTTSVGHCNCPCHRYNNMTHFSPCCYPKQVYKLDENGCLILKKK
jgi:hypothetical protein